MAVLGRRARLRITGRITGVVLVSAAVVLAPQAIGHAAPGRRQRSRHPVHRVHTRSITFEWIGDIALSTQRGLPPGGLFHALEPVNRQLHQAQVTMGNLEGTLSVGGSSKCGAGVGGGTCFAF
jgi:hypothetical protein